MKRSWIAGAALCLLAPAVLANSSPSSLMRQLPSIPDAPDAASCAAATTLVQQAEQYGMADMMRTQQMAMSAMSAGGSAVTDQQSALIQQILDPAQTMCDMNVAQSVAGADPADALLQEINDIQRKARAKVEADCPVTGMADYREPACVDPIVAGSHEEERVAIARYTRNANAQLEREVSGYAQCAEKREKLAAEAERVKLPVQFLSVAQGSRSSGWQTVASLAERYETFCMAAVSARDDLGYRERAR